MELVNIEKLLEKYFEATTTVAEEKVLNEYFSKEDVAPHLEEYKSMFNYFTDAKKDRFTKIIPLKTEKKKNYLKWISVAAIVVLSFGIYFNNYNKPSNSITNKYTQAELESAQKALVLLSNNFNLGTEKASYLTEFEKNTNKFLINK